ncbi:MAG TPA: glutathione S-transferase family protein [Rhizomicrobium sp.]|nr:glutathione S-transferase family protein [Rhizomicrobium sp.]
MITVTAFKWVPPLVRGLVRDLRVRWALEEAGLAYAQKLIGFEDQGTAWYRAQQPFGQVPVLEDDGLTLFESGSIVLHIGQKSPVLLPLSPEARARAVTWVFAALNTMEGAIWQLSELDLAFPNEDWAKARRPMAEQFVAKRLAELSAALGDREYLDGAFTAGDLMMATVLRILRHTDLVQREANLGAYLARCEARPAFQRALTAQLAAFEENAAAG